MQPELLLRFRIDTDRDTCGDLWGYSAYMLGQVSRTFALNINVLGGASRRSVLLAYLFMRMADTVEDDPHLSASEKDALLALFAKAFGNPAHWQAQIAAFRQALPASWTNSQDPNHYLCIHAAWPLQLLYGASSDIQVAISASVQEMCSGMAEFAHRQEARKAGWFTLESIDELDRYCYFVAGLVGNMLCDVFRSHSMWITRSRYSSMRELSVSFGLGLQIVNIIKDIGEDSTRKVCFVPEALCRKNGLPDSPSLFTSSDMQARRAIVTELIQKAWNHLDDAIRYTCLLPIATPRYRLFCLWPLFMAAETLRAVGSGDALFDPQRKVKISRDDVKRIVRDTTMHFYSNDWIRKQFDALRDH